MGDKYCQFDKLNNSVDFIKNGTSQDNKYYAIRTNVDKKNTVEFRIFRGTLKYNRFIATIQFVDAISHYIKNSLNLCISNPLKKFLFACTCNPQ